MKNWQEFWQKYRLLKIKDNNDLLYQVGKTLNKKVIDPEQFNIIVKEIKEKLDLKPDDNLLDLCCGNGVLTFELAKYVNSVVGIDFSDPYINNAKKFKNASNISYQKYDARKFNELNFKRKFSKVLMYDSLAYFNRADLEKLLEDLKNMTNKKARFLFGSILNDSKKWLFFNTARRRFFYYFTIRFLGRNRGIGKWWRIKELKNICRKKGLKCQFLKQNKLLYTAHYRIDLLILR